MSKLLNESNYEKKMYLEQQLSLYWPMSLIEKQSHFNRFTCNLFNGQFFLKDQLLIILKRNKNDIIREKFHLHLAVFHLHVFEGMKLAFLVKNWSFSILFWNDFWLILWSLLQTSKTFSMIDLLLPLQSGDLLLHFKLWASISIDFSMTSSIVSTKYMNVRYLLHLLIEST